MAPNIPRELLREYSEALAALKEAYHKAFPASVKKGLCVLYWLIILQFIPTVILPSVALSAFPQCSFCTTIILFGHAFALIGFLPIIKIILSVVIDLLWPLCTYLGVLADVFEYIPRTSVYEGYHAIRDLRPEQENNAPGEDALQENLPGPVTPIEQSDIEPEAFIVQEDPPEYVNDRPPDYTTDAELDYADTEADSDGVSDEVSDNTGHAQAGSAPERPEDILQNSVQEDGEEEEPETQAHQPLVLNQNNAHDQSGSESESSLDPGEAMDALDYEFRPTLPLRQNIDQSGENDLDS